MKRFQILISILLFGVLACGVIPTALPAAVPTISVPPTTLVESTAPTDEPSAPELLDEQATNPPSVTVSPSVASPQPAVAHHHPGDSLTLDRIAMIDASNGWAISGGDVLFTTDGAQTWQEVTPPETLTPGSTVQVQGAFLDTQRAWVIFSFDNQIPVNTTVWRTTDSGRTWTQSLPFEHEVVGERIWAEFFALDTTHVWLMMRGVYAGAGTHYVAQLFRSTDGGITWLSSIRNENFDYNYDYTGLVFANPENGWVTWQTTGAYAPAPPAYAATSDGGVNWDMRELPPPVDAPKLFETFDYCEPFQPHLFSDKSIRILMGCFDLYDPPHAFRSYLYSSEDGGSTWSSLPLPEKVLASRDTLFFFDKDNALLLGRDIYRSTDGGQSWKYVKSVTWDGQFTFVDPQTGWAIARANDQSALVKTSNDGTSWVEIKPVVAP